MRNISDIDPNFKVKTQINKEDIVFYSVKEAPFQIYGVFFENGKYRRMPERVAKNISCTVNSLHTNTAGGRVRFQTDSPYIAIHTKMDNIGKMPHFALTGSAGFDLYIREDGREQYVQTFVPPFTISDGYESVFELGTSSQTREITINFPLYSDVCELYIGLSERASVAAPQPYSVTKPVVYYGSSITQGGCASRPGASYESILSRKLDIDYVNLGFSGGARGEEELAHYIKGLDMSAFVYDYDHNAPTVEHLRNTHETMFRIIREANPDLPVVFMSRPKYCLTEEETERLEIIRETYNNAKANGDTNVYLIEGQTLMQFAENEGTVDNCHPNDLGFASIAKALEPVLAKVL